MIHDLNTNFSSPVVFGGKFYSLKDIADVMMSLGYHFETSLRSKEK
jgi:hypothetical protein